VSASLRGFYDDNLNAAPDGSPNKKGTYGVALTPGVSLNWQRAQTSLVLGYFYSFIYYEDNVFGQTKKYDQNHNFNLVLDHAFSERYQLKVSDSFVIGQEPDSLRRDFFETTQRVRGNNIRNAGSIVFNAMLTPLFGLEAGYDNAFFDYSADASKGFVIPTFSGKLDRIEQTMHLDGRWQALPQTTGVIGYQYGFVDYTGKENIDVLNPAIMSDRRNSRSHYGYVGLDHNFGPDVQGSVRVGARLTDYYNDPTTSNDVSPYVRLGLNYRFLPDSYVQAGFSYDRNSTDFLGNTAFGITQSQESAVFFAGLTHRILPKLYGNLTGTYQNSTFVYGSLADSTEQYYLLGANLEYKFTRWFSTQVGYSFTKIDSDAGRSYDRNRVYVGVTGSY